MDIIDFIFSKFKIENSGETSTHPVFNLNRLIHTFFEGELDDLILCLDERLFSNIKKIINYTQDSHTSHRKFKTETQQKEFMSKA